jgi:anti-anti-sigma regulatory factor
MGMTPVFRNIDEQNVAEGLRQAAGTIDRAEGEACLDLSSVCRVDSSALQAMEELVRVADEKGVKVILRGVNVDVYKVLKLTNLTRRFSFVN